MMIKSIRINGFAGIPHEECRGVKLAPLGRINILIGPNNAGKSTIFRFLAKVRDWMGADKWESESKIEPHDNWNHEDVEPIVADLIIAVTGKNRLAQQAKVISGRGETHLRFEMDSHTVSITPTCFTDELGPQPLWSKEGNGFKYATPDKSPEVWRASFFREFVGSLVFFDTVRALDRAGKRQMEDGSKVMSELLELRLNYKKSTDWDKFSGSLTTRMNEIFKPLGMPQILRAEMKKDDNNNALMQIYFDTAPAIPISLDSLGSGISQLLIILSKLILSKRSHQVVCIEEPETNLHPGLLRRFMDQLRKFTNVQFIFTTHSHVLLDCLEPDDEVFRLHQREDGSCGIERCSGIQKKHSLLDALGIRASSLLQTNCVIWVEGPSDRLYIRQWLKELAPEFAEGRDFTFNYYGGSLLAHLELNTQDDLVNDLVSMLWISRYAVVVMDSDLPPGWTEQSLLPRKKPILDAARMDELHRLALITLGRDIENDIPSDLLLKASAEILKCDFGEIAATEFKQSKGFEHDIIATLKLTDPDVIKSKTRKLRDNKIGIAMKVIQMCEKPDDPNTPQIKLKPPEYVKKVVELIRRSEQIEKVPQN